MLPRPGVVHDRVSDAADEVPSDVHAIDLGDVRLDIPRRQAAGVQRQDLVVKALKAPLTLADDLRLKAAITIARRIDPDRTVLGDQRLRRRPVARVARPAGRLLMTFIADVIGQLDLHRTFHQPLGQLRQQATRPDDLLLGPAPANSSSTTSSGSLPRRSSGTQSRIPDGGAGSPSGSAGSLPVRDPRSIKNFSWLIQA